MSQRWNRVFSAGIVWDPREPLPTELQDAYSRPSSSNPQGTAVPYLERQVNLGGSNNGVLPGRGIPGLQVNAVTPLPLIPHPLPREETTLVLHPPRVPRVLPSLTVQKEGRNVLPPLSVAVNASIVQDTARVSVTQNFWNDSAVPIKQAAFAFPLPAGCTVTSFSCTIGTNKTINGVVKPKEEAREAFNDHIRKHNTAAGLLEQGNPEIFTTTLGNIPDQTTVRIEIAYISILKHRFTDSKNVTTLILPTSIAPRYGDPPEEFKNAATAKLGEGLTLEVDVVESDKITSITSPSHPISADRQWGTHQAATGADTSRVVQTSCVRLEPGSQLLDKDFVLDIVTAPSGDTETPQAWLEEHPSLPSHKALMLTLPPSFLTKTSPPMQRSEIIFLADRSGSMSDKIPSLKSSMQFFLKGIPVGRRFNIWCFGSRYNSWQQNSVDYTEENLQAALAWVQSTFAADMGGTELLPAVKAVVSARDKALMTDVIILTDGQTWHFDQTLAYIQTTRNQTEGRVRFFALGIGYAVSHALVDGIAKAGGGYAEVVQDASRGGWEDRVVSMTKAALTSAHLGPLRLEFDIRGEDGETRSSTLAEAKRSPADISAISPFERNRIYFLFDSLPRSDSITSVSVQATANHGSKSIGIPVRVLEKRDTTLHKLGARSMLDDLERGRSHIHLGPSRPVPGSWDEINTVRKEAEEIACKWSLVSKWTSFFLAEEPSSPTDPASHSDDIPSVPQHEGTTTTAGQPPSGRSYPLTGGFLGGGSGYHGPKLPPPPGAVWPPLLARSSPIRRQGGRPVSPIPPNIELSWTFASPPVRELQSTGATGIPPPPLYPAHPLGAAAPAEVIHRTLATAGPPNKIGLTDYYGSSSTSRQSLFAGPPPASNHGVPAVNSSGVMPHCTTQNATQGPPSVEFFAASYPYLTGSPGNDQSVQPPPGPPQLFSRPYQASFPPDLVREEGMMPPEEARNSRMPVNRFGNGLLGVGAATEMPVARGGRDDADQGFGIDLSGSGEPPEYSANSAGDGRRVKSSPPAEQVSATYKHPSFPDPVQWDSRGVREASRSGERADQFGDEVGMAPGAEPARAVKKMRYGRRARPADSGGNLAWFTAKRSRPRSPKEDVVIPLDNGILDGSWSEEGVGVAAAGSGSAKESGTQVPYIPVGETYGHHPDTSFAWESGAPPITADGGGARQQQAERDFISLLLQHQLFDGHIDFKRWATAINLFGKEISRVLYTIQNTVAGVTAQKVWTAAVLVLLERDFKSCETLWELMASKMRSCFPEAEALELGLPDTVRTSLEGLELPVKKGGAVGIKVTEAAEQTDGSGSEREETAALWEYASTPLPGQGPELMDFGA